MVFFPLVPSPPPPSSTVHTMSFMAEAKLRNRHMMEQYKSHLRQQYTGKPIYNEAGLSMLRRLEENLSVARIREQNVRKIHTLTQHTERLRPLTFEVKICIFKWVYKRFQRVPPPPPPLSISILVINSETSSVSELISLC